MSSKPKILFAAYRDWALAVGQAIAASFELDVVSSPEQFEARTAAEHFDVIILVGWSWKVADSVVNSGKVIGMHPSDLPDYAGGSPIQHQILDGLEESKATLLRLTSSFDRGPILDKEPISLRGHLDEVFASIGAASTTLLLRYLSRWPDNPETPQPTERPPVRRRLKPADSRLGPADLAQLSCKALWDRIRAREAPYPNVYLEDETGRLTLVRVEFTPRDKIS